MTDETQDEAPRLSTFRDAPRGDTATNEEMAAWWLNFLRHLQERGAYSHEAYIMALMYSLLERHERRSGDDHYVFAVANAMEVEDLMKQDLFDTTKVQQAVLELEFLNTKVQKGLLK